MKKLSVIIPIFLTIVLAFSIIGNVSAQPSAGDYIVPEYNVDVLSSVTPSGVVTLIASGLSGPVGVAIDGSGNYIVTEFDSGELSSVTPGGVVTLIASGLSGPTGVAIDGSGNYIVTEQGSGKLSSVTPGGVVTLIASGLSNPEYVAIVPFTTVGGVATPVNKLEILAPDLALTGLVAAVTAAFTIRKRRKD